MAAPLIEILYEQGPCLAVVKPPGMLTQAPPGVESLELRIKTFLKDRDHKTGNVYLGVPHRLDRPVSGAMVFAKHARAARRLAEQFEARQVKKTYWAAVSGRVEPEAGTWCDYLRKVPNTARVEVVDASSAGAREAVLHYRTLGHADWGTWLEIELETGRMHQIRVQSAHRGHPVLGDADYGSAVTFGEVFDDPRRRAIALHARTLGFLHPMTFKPVSLTAPLPNAWQSLELSCDD